MVAALAARRRRRQRARAREAGAGRRLDRDVRRHRVGPEQPGDAGRRRARFLRGRDGPLRGGRRRRRAGVVVRAPPRLPHRRPGDGLVPAAAGASASSTARATATTTRTPRAATTSAEASNRCRSTAMCSAPGSTSCSPAWPRASGLAVMTNEARALAHYNRSVGAFGDRRPRRAPHLRGAGSDGQDLLTNGASLIGQLLRDRARRKGIPIWTEAPLDDLIVEDGGVVGVRTDAGRRARARPGPPRRAPRRRGLRPQPRDARAATAATSRTGPRGRSPTRATPARRSQTAMRLGAKTDLMDEAWWLPVAANGPVRAVDARPGPPAPPHHLRRRRRPALRERVELVHGGRQGDVRPRQDEPGRAVLADLRRPLPEAVRAPALQPRSVPPQAAGERAAQAGVDARRPRPHVRHRRRRPGRHDRAVQRARGARASTPTTGGASRRTTGRSATRTTRCTRASGRSTSRRTTPSRSCPATSAPAAASSPTSTRRSSTRTTARSTASTRRATTPPP